MASIVAAPIDDINAKQLNETLKGAVNGLNKPSKNDKVNDVLTTSNYLQAQGKLNYDIVGMFNHLNNRINDVESENTSLKAKLNSVETANLEYVEEITKLRKALVSFGLNLERHQQFQNRDTFKICGLEEPDSQDPEDTADTVIKALETADISLKKEEISASYRVPTGRDGSHTGPKNIMVKCDLHNTKDRVMRNKKILRTNAAFKEAHPNAFIVEQLTPLRSKVAYMLRHDALVEKSWTINGRIKVVLVGAEGNAKPKSIDSLSQLKQVMKWSDEKIEKLVLEQ